MIEALEAQAEQMRRWLAAGRADPATFRLELAGVPPRDRDAWVDRVFGIDDLPEDGPALPRGCVPYLPIDATTVLRLIDVARITADDLFVDIGAGIGRAQALVHCLTGAGACGIEVQPQLVEQARALAARLGAERVATIEGDADRLVGDMPGGTVFFLYCPFSGAPRLRRLLDGLEALARTRPLRICTVDLPLPACPWLAPVYADDRLVVYRAPG